MLRGGTALAWWVIAVTGLLAAILTALPVSTLPLAALIGLLAAVIPFFLGRGILEASPGTDVLAAAYALGMAVWLVATAGVSVLVILLGLVSIASWLVSRGPSIRQRDRRSPEE